jgi:LemA protein
MKWILSIAALACLLSGCGYNNIQRQDEATKAAWGEVLSQYQRRADLIPSLVETVKGAADKEQAVLVEVTEARAKVGAVQMTSEMANDAAAVKNFQAAQGQLSGALSRLIAVTENYPDIKFNQNFQDLQRQLEGTENRISVARKRYIDAVQNYNIAIRSFPANITASMFGYKEKPSFTVENEAQISKAPKVDFSAPKPASAQ